LSRIANVAGSPSRSPSRSLAYPLILALSALDAIGYSVIAPTLPALAATTGAGPATMGALAATFPLGIVVGFPIAGRWIQRRGTLSLLPLSSLVVAAGAVPFVVADGLGWFFAGRLVMGLGSGGLWMGVTYATLERWPGQEYRCMSRVFAAYSAGALLGPALGVLGGIDRPFGAYLVLALLGAAVAPLIGAPVERRAFHADRSALRVRGFALACAGIAFAVLALGVVDGVLPLHLATGLGQRGIAALFVAVAVIHAGGATLAGRLEPGLALRISAVLVVVGVAAAGVVDRPWAWAVTLAVAGIGVGLGETGSIGVLLRAVPAERSVTAMVVWSQIGIVGYLIGPLAGGAVAEVAGFAWVGLVPLAAALLLVALAVRTARVS
jgi:MFS family permease